MDDFGQLEVCDRCGCLIVGKHERNEYGELFCDKCEEQTDRERSLQNYDDMQKELERWEPEIYGGK